MLVPKNEIHIEHFHELNIDRKDPKEKKIILNFNRFSKIKLTFHVQSTFSFVRKVPFGVCIAEPGVT